MRVLTHDVIAGTTVWTTGSGPPLLVVHGGPGLDHRYLVEPLLPLATKWRLVFYDQEGSGTGGRLTPARLVRQLRRLLSALRADGAPALLAHSWGTWLAFACFASGRVPAVRALVLASPVALTRARFDASTQRQQRRFPAALLERVAAAGGLDLPLLRTLMPYYLARVNRDSVHIPVPHYDRAAAQQLGAGLGDYDFRGLCGRLPDPTLLVYGRDEVFRAQDTEEIHACATVLTLPRAGHFTFAEQPARFVALVARTLTPPTVPATRPETRAPRAAPK